MQTGGADLGLGERVSRPIYGAFGRLIDGNLAYASMC
jgi:hypothetical protein